MLPKEVILRLLLKEVNNIPSLQQQLRIIEQKIKKQIDDSLRKELATHVKSEISHAVDTQIYQSGIPESYSRRASDGSGKMSNPYNTGSLADPLEMEHSVSNGQLMVMDTALPSKPESLNMDLTYAIVHGYWGMDHWWNEPRDFLRKTRENLKSSNSHVEVMRNALKKRLGDVIK